MFHIKQHDNLWQQSFPTQQDAQDFLERTTGKRYQPYMIDIGVIGLFTEKELLAQAPAEFKIIHI